MSGATPHGRAHIWITDGRPDDPTLAGAKSPGSGRPGDYKDFAITSDPML